MILIGESINIMTTKIREAIKDRDPKPIQEMAIKQVEGGAHYLDINLGPAKKEGPEMMKWVIETVEEVVDVPLSLDTTNSEAIEAGLKTVKKAKPLINSISAQTERLDKTLKLAKSYQVPFIGLILSDEGIPRDVNERADVCLRILTAAQEIDYPVEEIWFDPIIFPVSADQKQVVEAPEFLKLLPDLVGIPNPKTTCGLSNVSNGSPQELRPLLNKVMLMILAEVNIYSAIVNTMDAEFMATVKQVEQHLAQGKKPTECITDTDVQKTLKVLRNEVMYCHSWLEL
ncbi:MAG: dihydropteroate synthase [bacterium]